MVLFTRQAAQLVLDPYRTTTTTEIFEWVRFASGKDLRSDDASTDTRVSSDLSYDITLQKHGLVVLAALPPRGRLMDGEDLAHANLGGYGAPAAAAPGAREAAGFADLAAPL